MRFKKVFSNLEPEGQGRGIIMEVTCLLLLGPFYTIQTNFMYFFAHNCKKQSVRRLLMRNVTQAWQTNEVRFAFHYMPTNVETYLQQNEIVDLAVFADVECRAWSTIVIDTKYSKQLGEGDLEKFSFGLPAQMGPFDQVA